MTVIGEKSYFELKPPPTKTTVQEPKESGPNSVVPIRIGPRCENRNILEIKQPQFNEQNNGCAIAL